MRTLFVALCVLSMYRTAAVLYFGCGPITLRNGFHHPQQKLHSHDAVVSYSCIVGMKPLTGTWWGTTTCKNGKWSPVPRCIDVILCLAPDVPNAKPTTEMLKVYTNGSRVEFVCDNGYEFDAGHVAECVEGRWKLPACRRKPSACDPPARVPNAAIVQPYRDVYEDGYTVEYVCETGYELAGGRLSSCRQKQWTSKPKCAKKKNKDSPSLKKSPVNWGSPNCQHPELDGGFFYPIAESYKPGSNVSYSCRSGLKLRSGTWWDVMTCQDRVWSRTPQCINASSCLVPHVPKANPLDPLKEIYAHMDNVLYRCERGYVFEDRSYAWCIDGRWILPVCKREAGSCPAPERVDNALIKEPYKTFYYPRQRIEYSCMEGHDIVGEASSTCQQGRWTSTPECPFIVNCSPPTIEGGFYGPLSDVHEHGSKVYYSCDRGLKPALYTWWGELRCSNGTWTPAPRCIDKSYPSPSRILPTPSYWPPCDPPNRLYNAFIRSPVRDWYDVLDRIEYACESGFTLVGERLSSCTREGWTSEPTCERVMNCQRPTLEAGFLHPDLDVYPHSWRIFYGCNQGLKPAFNAWWGETWCDDGTWSHTPQCIDQTSCLAPSVSNAQPTTQFEVFYLNGSRVEFACDHGYRFDGGRFAECTDGQWRLPACRRQPSACDPPAPVSAATIVQHHQEIYEEGDTIEYACETGYELAGEKFSSCQQSQWTSAPTCVQKKDLLQAPAGSPLPPSPLHCRRPRLEGGFFHPDQEHYKPGLNVSYSCHGGLKPVIGTWWGVMTCQSGEWSHTPSCVGAGFCLAPPKYLPNARLRDPPLAVYPYWASISYTCDRGYSYPYREHAECERGQWKMQYCRRKEFTCDPPPRVENAIVNQPYEGVFNDEDRVEYVCRKGYELVGESFSKCYIRNWSHQPKCVVKEVNPNPTESPFQPVELCGRRPYVPDADVWEQPGGKELKVQCYEHFELDGEERITCVGGKWTALPTCTPECEMDTSLFFQYSLGKYLKRGVKMMLRCSSASYHYIDVRCVNGKTLYKGCGFNDW